LAHDDTITIHANTDTIKNGIFQAVFIFIQLAANIQIPVNIAGYFQEGNKKSHPEVAF
jgi:hypothetical protein